ncbi:MFS transporter [Caulobacter flavus]|uniref:MFS transporter n=1 Tax=Caulobacter flavus TaxID=1679497 RepID=A0A2N5CXB8_9CAUL|nr:MFS transporter [Caulobacter flavus]AYV47565.1 MFS transporter [Caulobacter flavus]PLR18406.1 MFS transporter [Caulobacter flavus]
MTRSMSNKPSRLPWITAAASFGFLVTQLDVTIVNVALDAIGDAFDAPTAQLQWVVDAYVLALAAMLLSAGAIGDRVGPKRAFLAGLVLFGLASAACGFATGPLSLILARVAQGAAGALLIPPSLALIAHAAHGDDRRRVAAVGWWTAAGGVSIAAGPVLGGLLVETLGWRWVFFVNLPLCAIGAVLALLVAPATPAKPRVPFDLPGQALAVAAVTLLVGGLIEGGHRGWGGAPLAALAAGLVLAAVFVAFERHAKHPAMPLTVFRSRPAWSAVVVGSALNFTYYGLIFVLGLYMLRTLHWSPGKAGLAFLPLTATFIVSNLASGSLVGRFGARTITSGGVLVAACGYALTARLGAESGVLDMLPGFALIPGGMGLAIPALTSGLLASVDRHDAGAASGVLNACRQVGGAAGVAIFGALAGAGIATGLRASAILATAMLVAAAGVLLAPGRRGGA